MKTSRTSPLPLAAIVAGFLWQAATLHAQTTTQVLYHVTMNTSQLADHPAEPFSLQVVLTDASGSGDANSSVTITNINLGNNGNADGDPRLEGDASGDMSTAIVLGDATSESDFWEPFTPGDQLSFDVLVSLSLDPSDGSDDLVIAIVDAQGQRIPTLDPMEENVLLRFTTSDGATVTAESYRTDSSVDPFTSGPPLAFGPRVWQDGAIQPDAPLLSISRNPDSTATIQWPALYSSYVLQSTVDFTTWNIEPASPELVFTNYFDGTNFVNATNFLVTLPTADIPVRFFRLAQ